MNFIDKIKGNIGKRSKELSETDIPEIHHRFMVVYGWISVKEFNKIPLPTFWGLFSHVEKEYKLKMKKYHYIEAIAKSLGVKDR